MDLVRIDGTMTALSTRLSPLLAGVAARQAASRTARVQAALRPR